jgi:uncharacterized protein with GYD domain
MLGKGLFISCLGKIPLHYRFSDSYGKNMQKYLVLVKLNPAKTETFYNSLSTISERPMDGIRVNASYNVFGSWDSADWFEASSNENAIHFVGEKIRSIEGVNETLTMPATALKEYNR